MTAEPEVDQPLEVKLPTCLVCGHVARYDPSVAGIGGRMKFACNGGRENKHKPAKMQMIPFRQVMDDDTGD